MRLIINGESRTLTPAPVSLHELLAQLGYVDTAVGSTSPGAFVVALNQHIVSAGLYQSTRLQADDCIDILGAITGG